MDKDVEDIYDILEKKDSNKRPGTSSKNNNPDKSKEEQKEASQISQDEYLKQIMSEESKNQIPPRTPVDVKFRSTSSRISIASLRPDSAASKEASSTMSKD